MKEKMAIKFLMILLFSFFLFSCQVQNKEESSKEKSYGAAPVKVFKVKRQRISEKLNYTGVIKAWEKIEIVPDISGKIAKIYVEEGDDVQKRELLAELDTKAIRLQLEQAEAGVAVAEANFRDTERNMKRMERLKSENAVSEQQVEKVTLAYDSAKAQLQQAEAALNLARHNLDVSIMEAPFSGVIASKNAEVGDMINPMTGGGAPGSGVITLMDFSTVKIEVELTYKDILRVKKGQPAHLKTSAFPNRLFDGVVNVVNLTADSLSKKFSVEIKIENKDMLLKPNTFGEVILEVSTRDDALVIPQSAILEGKYVFIAGEGDVAVKKEVSIGLENSDVVEIAKGLQEEDLVIVDGNYGLEEGTKIEIVEVVQ